MRTMSYDLTLSGMLLLCMISACGQTYNSVPRHDSDYDIAAGVCEHIWLEHGLILHETPEHDWGVRCVFEAPAIACEAIGGNEFLGVNPHTGEYGFRLCGKDVFYPRN